MTDDAALLSTGTVAELERRAEALESEALYHAADDWAALNGSLRLQFECQDMARKMRARAADLAG